MFTNKRFRFPDRNIGSIISFDGNEFTYKNSAGVIFEMTVSDFKSQGMRFENERVQNELETICEWINLGVYDAANYSEVIQEEPVRRHMRTLEEDLGEEYCRFFDRTSPLTYSDVESKHNISILGPGRGINTSRNDGSLVLISQIKKVEGHFTYNDSFSSDGDYIYSGEGQTGDQKLTGGNKKISDSRVTPVDIHLYIKTPSREYFYQGLYKCVDVGTARERGGDDVERTVFKFRLRKQ